MSNPERNESFSSSINWQRLYRILGAGEDKTPESHESVAWWSLRGGCFQRSAALSDGSANRLIRSWPGSSRLTLKLKCSFAILDKSDANKML